MTPAKRIRGQATVKRSEERPDWGNIARKAAAPAGYWLVLGLITFLGLNAVIKIEATGTRLFLVVIVISVALGAASLLERLLMPGEPAAWSGREARRGNNLYMKGETTKQR